MKLIRRFAPAALALMLCAGTVPFNASAVSVGHNISAEQIVTASENNFSNYADASRYVKKCIKNRQAVITFSIPDSFDFNDAFINVIRGAFAESESGSDGDYLRTAVKRYSCDGMYDGRNIVMSYTMQYRTTAEQENFVDKKVSEILRNLNLGNKTDYEKIKAVYEYLISHVEYEKNLNGGDTIFTAYGALYNGRAVCQGYTHLMYRLLKDAGVSTRVIVGTANGSHAWNIVSAEGLYYLCDATWDSSCKDISSCSYFMKGSDDFDKYDASTPHVADKLNEAESPFNVNYYSASFKSSYPISKKAYNPSAPVVNYSIGDVNDDGSVDSSDASLILTVYSRMSTGGESGITSAQKSASDINHDGLIDSSDASLVLTYYSYVQTGGNKTPSAFFGEK